MSFGARREVDPSIWGERSGGLVAPGPALLGLQSGAGPNPNLFPVQLAAFLWRTRPVCGGSGPVGGTGDPQGCDHTPGQLGSGTGILSRGGHSAQLWHVPETWGRFAEFGAGFGRGHPSRLGPAVPTPRTFSALAEASSWPRPGSRLPRARSRRPRNFRSVGPQEPVPSPGRGGKLGGDGVRRPAGVLEVSGKQGERHSAGQELSSTVSLNPTGGQRSNSTQPHPLLDPPSPSILHCCGSPKLPRGPFWDRLVLAQSGCSPESSAQRFLAVFLLSPAPGTHRAQLGLELTLFRVFIHL